MQNITLISSLIYGKKCEVAHINNVNMFSKNKISILMKCDFSSVKMTTFPYGIENLLNFILKSVMFRSISKGGAELKRFL